MHQSNKNNKISYRDPQSMNRVLISNYIKTLPKKYKDISFASALIKNKELWGLRIIYKGQEFHFEAGGDMATDTELLQLINLKIADLCQN